MSETVQMLGDDIKRNTAKRGAWKKIQGVVQPGGIYQLGNHPVFIYPPNHARAGAPGKWILMDNKTAVGAFVSLKAAKDHYAGDIEAGHHYGTEKGYFPNPTDGTTRNYIIGEIRSAINNAEASKEPIDKQAYISYAQGIVRACGYLEYFTKPEVAKWHRLLNSIVK